MDTLAQRFELLRPAITRYGPDDNLPRPAVVLFHGCGGLRPHVHQYAQAVALKGVRAIVVDSFKPRGWGRTFAVSLICTGAVMHGYERAGDVLAVLWGLKQDPSIDYDNLILVGFSHGAWAIMDLMTAPLTRAGEVKVSDPDASLLTPIKGVYLVYPYINFPARSNKHKWLRSPKTVAAIAEKDHLTPAGHARKIFDDIAKVGVDTQVVSFNATHAFDEEDNQGLVMQYSKDATEGNIKTLCDFAESLILPAPTPAVEITQ